MRCRISKLLLLPRLTSELAPSAVYFKRKIQLDLRIVTSYISTGAEFELETVVRGESRKSKCLIVGNFFTALVLNE